MARLYPTQLVLLDGAAEHRQEPFDHLSEPVDLLRGAWLRRRGTRIDGRLRACETAVQRMASDRHYFAHPSRTLFREIRAYFPMSSQLRVLQVVERYLNSADEFLRRLPKNGFDVDGRPLQCRASTRRGTPCQRMPLPRNGYCPSHQHLAETEQAPTRIAARRSAVVGDT